ncbi:SUMF1/EgtB/PvdOfamily nonheme iron enzyme [Lujinxingia vulgaris]|uniref:SUMF1/EgtB/PvdOfamily nonheme iron enzyme n=1 Tax=Lujinxingia vulgaris TaxID=2600176 RepID=A0A5C6X749_9DELT|nr:SUMF1/EgtB/PvdO family nonheme iron enzyme [Lujinxingia vulgaris]TXD36080.1 SUMF1/EgtB/PvdOfamily nonheme iron enzyme [Lujinxingia vulgaris]
MSEVSQVSCPECGAEQSSGAPFCGRCGYRMRPAETVREGMAPVRRSSQSGGQERPARASQTGPGGSGLWAVEEGRTVMEGMQAIQAGDRPQGTADAESDEDARGGEEAPRAWRGRVSGVVWGSAAVCLVAMASMSWMYLKRAAVVEGAVEEVRRGEPGRVEVEAGPYLRGLSEQAQSFMMLSCHQLERDEPERCEQEELLAGEYPQRTVTLKAYAIDRLEVSVGAYQRCVDEGACEAIDYDGCEVWTPRGLQVSLRVPRVLKEAGRAVVCVTREEARAYCGWAGGALPTHDQWERAARGVDGGVYPWGDHWESESANWGERDVVGGPVAGALDGYVWTAPVGRYEGGVSPAGVWEMAGNVAEWVEGEDPLLGAVRGGSWVSNPFELRSTARVERKATARRTDVGFRCAYGGR